MIDKELIDKAEKWIEENKPVLCFGNISQAIVTDFKFTTVYDLIIKTRSWLTIKAEDKSIWCQPHKNRTISDLFLLAKYYGFDKSLYDFYIFLYGEIHDDKRLGSFICKDIDKRVYFVTGESSQGNYFTSDLEDEFGVDLVPLIGDLKTYIDGYGGGNSIKNYSI